MQDALTRVAPDAGAKGLRRSHGRHGPAPSASTTKTSTKTFYILALPNLRVGGLHIYSGTQCLKAEAIGENYPIFLEIFRDISDRYDLTPEKLAPARARHSRPSGDRAPRSRGGRRGHSRARSTRSAKRRASPPPPLVLELGRFLVGEAGYFLTRVVLGEGFRGSRIAICDGGMNTHLPASGYFGMVIHRNYRDAQGWGRRAYREG